MLARGPLIEATKNSLVVAVLTVIVSTLLGGAAGIFLARWKGRSGVQEVVASTVPMPLLLPGLIWGLALLILFSRFGTALSSGNRRPGSQESGDPTMSLLRMTPPILSGSTPWMPRGLSPSSLPATTAWFAQPSSAACSTAAVIPSSHGLL
jgi:ABC-type Fe3+ transport system permease subunit